MIAVSRRALLAAPLLLGATRCAFAQAPDQEWRGITGGGPAEATELARTDAEWRSFWARLRQPAPFALPASAMGLWIALGMRTSGGYGIRVERIAADGGALVVTWTETRPAPGTMQTQQITDPYLIRLLPRTDLPVRVVKAGQP